MRFNLLTTLVTDSIEKRRGQVVLFSFRWNLVTNLLADFSSNMDMALVPHYMISTKGTFINDVQCFLSIFDLPYLVL